MKELCPEQGEGFPVPPDELFEEWEAEVAHTTLDETWHVAKRAAAWGYRQSMKDARRLEARELSAFGLLGNSTSESD
jgi:hypothetical protein